MRRMVPLIPLLGIALALPGCVGFGDFVDDTMTLRTNPNMPMGDSLNMRRVRGQQAEAAPIAPEAGNVWPRGVEPMPTLQDIDTEHGAPARPPAMPRPSGSSAIVAPVAVKAPPAPAMTPPTPLAAAPTPPATVIPTMTGPATVTNNMGRYQTVNTPTGAAVVVPNGNGTATLMRADGTMETVNLPR